MLKQEIQTHMMQTIVPFWNQMLDKEHGGFYGFMDHALKIDKKADKGCILNSRILWFYSNAWLLTKDDALLEQANHAWGFLKDVCLDRENGGVFWSVSYDGTPRETLKHTYNQAFAVYALSSYYDATGNQEVLRYAKDLYLLIETNCYDGSGYGEAFDRTFRPVSNEKLSENGVLADRTMNTVLHVLEAYTELYRVTKDTTVKQSLLRILEMVEAHIYNSDKKRQEVFFDKGWNSLIDLHSYGHDIEAAWLIDRSCEVLGEDAVTERIRPMTQALTETVYRLAYRGDSVLNESKDGIDDTSRIWWVQAEALVGFLNGYQKTPEHTEYLDAVHAVWGYIKEIITDKRPGAEWHWQVNARGIPDPKKPVVEAWKCPYHNGRMCIEAIRRLSS